MEIQTENLGAPKGILSTHTGPMRERGGSAGTLPLVWGPERQ
jgi:hypothetical protein